jgi:hypothetical protein
MPFLYNIGPEDKNHIVHPLIPVEYLLNLMRIVDGFKVSVEKRFQKKILRSVEFVLVPKTGVQTVVVEIRYVKVGIFFKPGLNEFANPNMIGSKKKKFFVFYSIAHCTRVNSVRRVSIKRRMPQIYIN